MTATPVPVTLAPATSPLPDKLKERPSTFSVDVKPPGASGRKVIMKLKEPPGASGKGSGGRPETENCVELDVMLLKVVVTELVFVIWNRTALLEPTAVEGNGIVSPGETGTLSMPNAKDRVATTPLPVRGTVRGTPAPTKGAVPEARTAL